MSANPIKGHKKYKKFHERKEDINVRKKKQKKELKVGTIKGIKKGNDMFSNLYRKNACNQDEIKINLYLENINEIGGIIEGICNNVSLNCSTNNIKRIIFETGYGSPKKSIDIRKNGCKHLINNMGYIRNKSGGYGTFKMLDDFANRIIVYPKTFEMYNEELIKKQEIENEILKNKIDKEKIKRQKKQKKYYVRNKWKKQLKYKMSADIKKENKKNGLNSDEGSNDDENNMQYIFNLDRNNLSKLSKKKLIKNDNEMFNGIKDKKYKYRYESDDRGLINNDNNNNKLNPNKRNNAINNSTNYPTITGVSDFYKSAIQCSRNMPSLMKDVNGPGMEQKLMTAQREIERLKKELKDREGQIGILKNNSTNDNNDDNNDISDDTESESESESDSSYNTDQEVIDDIKNEQKLYATFRSNNNSQIKQKNTVSFNSGFGSIHLFMCF